jgi:hypothetical protein
MSLSYRDSIAVFRPVPVRMSVRNKLRAPAFVRTGLRSCASNSMTDASPGSLITDSGDSYTHGIVISR